VEDPTSTTYEALSKRGARDDDRVPRVLIICFSELASDARVDRQIEALRGRFDLVAAGFGPPRDDAVEFIDISTPPPRARARLLRLARLVTRRYEAAYWRHPLTIAVLDRLRGVTADVVIANELFPLPLALSLGRPVVFDAHEYAPAQYTNRLLWRLLHSPYARWQCRRYIPRVAAVTTVGPSIRDAYERETGVRARIVLNAPRREKLEPTTVNDPIRVLHHGAAIGGRGLEGVIRVAELLDERVTVDFMLVENWPGYRDSLIRRARGNPRIRFPSPQPLDRLVRAANEYDIGLHVLAPANANQRYALPNKLFEFIQARLAVAIGPSPDMAQVVREHGCGIVAADFEPETIARELNALDASSIAGFKRASHVAADVLCAEENARFIVAAVEDALAARQPAPAG